MTYRVPRRLADTGVESIRPGTSLLLTGPGDRTEELVYDLLASGHANGDHTVVITTDAGTTDVVEALRSRSEPFDPQRVGVVDTTDTPVAETDVFVERLGSTGDLTGISLGTAKIGRRFDSEVPLRLGLTSVSTLLMYVDLRTVFRFLHVFTSRITAGNWLGVFTLDPSMHDDQTLGTLRAVFDGEVRVGEEETETLGSGFTRSE
ncbi:DUF7504 family protein [Halomarina litorea]|uniref:DUF7504 family protein n=1 Tax=Halomarina litorea TaxID=2961595 RepID=UPI0020C43358|nr:recombinase RecA [Halomarina sp. BCD28]